MTDFLISQFLSLYFLKTFYVAEYRGDLTYELSVLGCTLNMFVACNKIGGVK